MKIHTKERIATIVALAVIGLTAMLIWWTHKEVDIANRQRQQASEIARALSQLRLLTFEYRLYRNERTKAQWHAVSDRVDRAIANTNTSTPAQDQILAKVRERRGKVKSIFAELTAVDSEPRDVQRDEAIRLFENTLLSRFLAEQQENFADIFRLTDIASERIHNAQRRMLLIALAGLLLLALTKIFTSWIINHDLLGPLLKFQDATRAIGAGNWNFKFDAVGNNELGQLQKSFNAMAEQIETQTNALREARDEAQTANRMKSEFLANMSHELRTPLNGVIGFSQFLADEKVGPVNAKQKEFLIDILNSGRHQLQLINDILDLSKVESGKMGLFPETFGLSKAVEESCAVVSPLVEKKNITLVTKIEPTLPDVTLDRQKFKQILLNLLSNAVKFTNEGGRVEVIAAAYQTGHFQLLVRDTGIGISPADIDKLFVVFQQIDSGTSRRHEGTGLGLALTKKLVELMWGSITVNSVVGTSSTFTVILPLNTTNGPRMSATNVP